MTLNLAKPRLFRALWHLLLRLRFHLVQRKRLERPVLEEVAGRTYLVLPGVFNPALFYTSELLVGSLESQELAPGARVLELGCGSGVSAVTAARLGAHVVAVDLNPDAVRCTLINAHLHQVAEKLDVRHGDLFAPVMDETYDVILFNPPYLEGEPESSLEMALYARGLATRFASGLQDHLNPQGYCLLVLSDIGAEEEFCSALRQHRFLGTTIAQRQLPLERLRVYRWERK